MGSLWEAWFDGVCEPVNPGGHAAYGILIKKNGQLVKAGGQYVGHGAGMSNNVAEYSGCLAVLEHLAAVLSQRPGIVIIRGDSKLVIQQLCGKWKIHGGHYVPFYRMAQAALGKVRELSGGNVRLEWVPRAKNGECDEYSKQELRDRGIKFRIQPEESHPK